MNGTEHISQSQEKSETAAQVTFGNASFPATIFTTAHLCGDGFEVTQAGSIFTIFSKGHNQAITFSYSPSVLAALKWIVIAMAAEAGEPRTVGDFADLLTAMKLARTYVQNELDNLDDDATEVIAATRGDLALIDSAIANADARERRAAAATA